MLDIFIIFGLLMAWFLFWMIYTFFLNLYRAKQGSNLNDEITAFWLGFATGPLAFLAIFNQAEIARGRAGARIWGGIFGCLGLYFLYQNITSGGGNESSPRSRGSGTEVQSAGFRGTSPSGPTPNPANRSPSVPPAVHSGNRTFDLPRIYSQNWSHVFGNWIVESFSDHAGTIYCQARPYSNNISFILRYDKQLRLLHILQRIADPSYGQNPIIMSIDRVGVWNVVPFDVARDVDRNIYFSMASASQDFIASFRAGSQLYINSQIFNLTGSNSAIGRLLNC